MVRSSGPCERQYQYSYTKLGIHLLSSLSAIPSQHFPEAVKHADETHSVHTLRV